MTRQSAFQSSEGDVKASFRFGKSITQKKMDSRVFVDELDDGEQASGSKAGSRSREPLHQHCKHGRRPSKPYPPLLYGDRELEK